MTNRSNVGRNLTIILEITNDIESSWIWENHKGNKCQGVDIFCIHEGDIFKQYDHFFENDAGFDRNYSEKRES